MSNNPVVLITGANTGLGLEIVKALAESPSAYTIIVGSRNVSNGEAAIASVKTSVPNTTSTFITKPIDVESDDSIAALAADVTSQFGRVDVLVNNAGVAFDALVAQGKMPKRDAWVKSWNVNVAGADIMTEAFVPLLLKSATTPRIVFITSGTCSLAETDSDATPDLAMLNASPAKGWPKAADRLPTTIYRSSKTGMNMMFRQWHRVLKNDGVKVFAINPGFLMTGLNDTPKDALQNMGALEPSVGGNFAKNVIAGQFDDLAGLALRENAVQPW